jgi:hypothetical protein
MNPNDSGAVIAFLTWFTIAVGYYIKWPWRAAVAVLGLFSLMLTFSRGAILIYIFMGFCYYFLNSKISIKRFFIKSIVIVLIIIVFYYVLDFFLTTSLSEDASMRVLSIRNNDFEDQSVVTRSDAIIEYTRLFIDSPFFGARSFGSIDGVIGVGPHNSFLALAADFGVFIALLPILISCLVIERLVGSELDRHTSAIVLTPIFWIVFSSLFSHNIFYSPYGAIALGIAIGSSISLRKKPIK